MSLIPPNISFENLNLGEFDDSLPFRMPVITVKEWLRREKRLTEWKQFAKTEIERENNLKLYPTKEDLEDMQQKYSELQEYLNEAHPPTDGLTFEVIDGKCISRPVNIEKLKKFRE